MKFCDKLIALRREKGYSQEQLALMLGVSRQSVSKWEADSSMPEISKILQISDIFKVTTDYLLKDSIEKRQSTEESVQKDFGELSEKQARILEKLEKIEKKEAEAVREYEYKSGLKLFGLPLVHIHFKWSKGSMLHYGFSLRTPGAYADFKTKARGIVAIGNNASGVLSIGFLAKGIISVGLYSAGVFSIGIMCLGLLALGIMALGGFAAGIVAIGYIALGVAAMGIYGAGVSVVAKKAAIGVVAVAHTALGSKDADGTHVLLLNQLMDSRAVEAFFLNYQPAMPKWILQLLVKMADSFR